MLMIRRYFVLFASKILLIVCIVLSLLLLSCETKKIDNKRELKSIDLDWKFIQKDIQGAENISFDDSEWRQLNLPHDWSIEGEYNKNNSSGIAGAFLPTGIGWYRKNLDIEKLQADDKYFVEFAGVYMNSDVWINGHHLGNRPNGYISFSYDIRPYLQEGANLLAVRVDHSKTPSGRWYTGSGIYRHVWLTKTKNIYIPQWGTNVTTPEVSIEKALVNLGITVKNETGEKRRLTLQSVLIDSNGEEVVSATSNVQVTGSILVDQTFEVNKPKLWSPEYPNMYTIQTTVMANGNLMDTYTTPMGIRSIEMRGSKGFFLNGESIKFKGLSNHHDAGPVGSAVPDDVLYDRLKLLKEMGCNALRTTHNPFSPTFYTMCDTMGFMVMNEAFDGWWIPKATHDYGNYFNEWWERDLTDFVKRDRNHPSVVMWSIGNEVRGFTAAEQKIIVDFMRNVDDTRPITQGRGHKAPYVDLAGFNGHGEFKESLETYHKKHPDKAIIGTEITHTLQTRGIYRTQTWYRTKDNPAPWEKAENFAKMESRVYKIPHLSDEEVFNGITNKYQSSYDNSIVRIGIRDDWNRVEAYDYYLGNFRWTGFDYLGESFGWPARTANFGIIDLAGFPKDHFFLYQSLWSDEPMVHLLPHWTHPGKEGIEIPVVVYTNCESAELFLNEKSLGIKEMDKDRQLVWLVPYEAGKITVIAHNGVHEVCQKSYITAGKAMEVQLLGNRKTILANQTDIVRVEGQIIDDNGVMLPDADHLIEFEIKGPAKLLGVENGDILDLEPHQVNYRKAFKGKCLLLIQSTEEKGIIEIKATSNQLKTAIVKIVSI
jgi:beta-galactosidase